MEGICGKVTLQHMSFVRCSVLFRGDELQLIPDWTYDADTIGMISLLSSFGIEQSPPKLEPCFDLAELSRRNQMMKESRTCS
jgi:hypothetical protein